MEKEFTGYLPTDAEINDIAEKFSFRDRDELRYSINNAFWQLKIYSYSKRTQRDPSELIQQLNHRCKEMQYTMSRLSASEMSCLEENYDEDAYGLINEVANKLSLIERLTQNTLHNIPSSVIIAKKIPVWWFIWELADLWKSEIGQMPRCNYSTINGYSGKFYRFILECAALDGGKVYISGAMIKNVLQQWHKDNPMHTRKNILDS